MTFVSTHSSLASLMGSWPVIPSYISGTATFNPRVIEDHAVIMGVKRETSAGFNVAGMNFYLYVDGFTVSERKTINFNTYSDPYTLDQVIAEINADVGATVAYNDNGFLRLESRATLGESSALWLQTFNYPEVFHELGLFSGIAHRGGSLKQAKHVDPDRQVALPYQAAISDGESFTADVINRAIHTLAVNTDRTEGVIGRKRIAKQEVKLIPSYTPTGTPSEEGVQFSGGIQVFTGAATAPSVGALENLFAVLDADGREYTKRVTTVLTTDTVIFTYADGRQIATDTGGNFVAADEKDEIYVVSSSGSLPAALQGVPMKILEVQSANVAVIQPIDPATGNVILFATGGVSTDRIDYSVKRCRVDEVRTSQSGSRVEGVNEQVSPPSGSHVPARIDLNNRIVVPGATFVSDGVQVGDQVVWASYGPTVPYSNNGTYRVSQLVDEETIEVVAEDWGPAFLNPDLSTPGNIVISTDGQFYQDPFVRFLPEASGGAIPDAGDYIKIAYLEMTDLRTATDDPAAFSGGGVRYQQEADDTVQKAILAIIGPSATTINDYLHDDARNSMENIDYRLDFEHYPSDTVDAGTGNPAREGRHRAIRPDTINMWPEIGGETFTVRGATADTAGTVKMALRDESNNLVFDITKVGRVNVTVNAAAVASGFTRYQIIDDSNDVHYKVQADGKVGIYENATTSSTLIELDAGGPSGVGTGISRATLAGEAATGPAALLTMVADASATNPLIYSLDVDAGTGELAVSVNDDGSGGSVANALTVSSNGSVNVNTILDVNLPTATGTAMTVDYSGGSAFKMNVNASGEAELWAVGDGYDGGGNISMRGADAITSSYYGGDAYVWAGNGVAESGGWAGLLAGDGTPGGLASVYGGDALAGTDIDGGDVEIDAGRSTGSGYSSIFFKVAEAGATGTTFRNPTYYLICNGGQARVVILKDIHFEGGDRVVHGWDPGSATDGGDVTYRGGNAASHVTNYNGGDVTVSGGSSEGSGYSNVFLKAAIAGASGSDTRTPETFMAMEGSTGHVVLYKDLYTSSGGRYIPQIKAMTTEQELTYTTLTAFSSTQQTIAANTLSAGSTIRIKASGYVSVNGASHAIGVRLREAGGASDSVTFAVSAGGYFYIEAVATIWGAPTTTTAFRFLGQAVTGVTGGGAGTASAAGTTAVAPTMDSTQTITVEFVGVATGSSTTEIREFVVDIT